MFRRAAAVAFVVALATLATPWPDAAGQDPSEALAKARSHQELGEWGDAIEVLRDALEEAPGDPEILLELGRSAYGQAQEILSSANPTLGQLALIDAITWLEKAVAAAPTNAEAQSMLGTVAVQAGDFAKAEAAWRRVVELEPGNGEARYQLGYCLAYLERFAEAVEAFREAEKVLGPETRILLNRGICHYRLNQIGAARDAFLTILRREIAGERYTSDATQSALVWLWRIHSERNDFAGAEALFARVAEEFPSLVGGPWYLGHSRMRLGKASEAAAAFERVTKIAPAWTAGWIELAYARLEARQPEAAMTALIRVLDLDPTGDTTREVLLATWRGLVDAKKFGPALGLLDTALAATPDDAILLEKRGDTLFRMGRTADAIETYRTTAAVDPFADEVLIKAQKAATVLLRAAEIPEELAPLRPEEPDVPEAGEGGEGGVIFDFEEPEVFVRPNGPVEGTLTGGGYRLARTGGVGTMANLALTLIPTLDTRTYDSLVFRVKGPAGKALLVRAKDFCDEFTMAPHIVRLLHEKPVILTGEEQEVALTLDGFVSVSEHRPVPFQRSRLRTLIFEIGQDLVPDAELAEEVWIDDVRLLGTREGARPPRVLADFDKSPAETVFLTNGVAQAFAPLLASEAMVEKSRPDPNTYVSPAIFREAYDPAMVHSGEGSFRMTLPSEGPASGGVTFNPDRSFEEATAITFWAKGEEGGERVRVVFRDALDEDLANPAPPAAPRIHTPTRLVEGWFRLSTEWRRYRIPRGALPDVDFRSLLEIGFHFGTPQGNPPGTTIYLDDIRYE